MKPKLTDREIDLFEALAHAMCVATAGTGDPEEHKQWVAYHLGRALQGAPQAVADKMVERLDKMLS